MGKHKKNQKGQKENSYVFLNRPTQNYYMCLGVYFYTLHVLYRNFTTICHHNLLCSYFDDKYNSIIIIAHLTNKMQCNLDHKPVYRDQSSTEVSNKRPTVLLKTSFWHLCQSDNDYQTPVRSVLGMRAEWTNQGTSVFRRSFSNVWVDWIQTSFFLVVLHWRKGS